MKSVKSITSAVVAAALVGGIGLAYAQGTTGAGNGTAPGNNTGLNSAPNSNSNAGSGMGSGTGTGSSTDSTANTGTTGSTSGATTERPAQVIATSFRRLPRALVLAARGSAVTLSLVQV